MILLTTSTAAHAVSQDINSYRWQHRLLLVSSDSPDDMQAEAALRSLSADETALEDRRIIIYHITPDSFRRYDKTSWNKSDEVFNSYVDKTQNGQVILIGLDGGIKNRYPLHVKPETIWADIDKMPMRRQELRHSSPN